MTDAKSLDSFSLMSVSASYCFVRFAQFVATRVLTYQRTGIAGLQSRPSPSLVMVEHLGVAILKGDVGRPHFTRAERLLNRI